MPKKEESIKRQALNSLIWKFMERISAQFVSFVVSLILARILLPEDYGVIALVTVFITFADVFVSNGLGTALIQKKDADQEDFSTIFYAGIGLSLVFYLIVYAGAPIIAKIYDNPLIVPVLRVMGLRLPVSAVNSVQQAYVSRRLDFKKFFYATIIGTVISGIVGVYMALNGFGVWALVGQYLTNSFVDTLILFITVGWRPKLLFSFDRLRELMNFGSRVMFTKFIGTLFNQMKSLIIGVKYTSSDLAFYNRGEVFPVLIASNIETSVDSVLFPTLSQFQNDKEKIKNIISRFVSACSFLIMPMMVGLAFTAETVIRLLLTEKWLPCVPYLRFICIQQIFSVINTANLQVLKSLGEGNKLVKLEFIKKPIFLIILILSMMVSPLCMAFGAAVYEIIGAVINSRPVSRLINYSLSEQIKDILPNLSASLIMGAFVYMVTLLGFSAIATLIIQIVVGVAVYIGIAFVFKNPNMSFVITQLKRGLIK